MTRGLEQVDFVLGAGGYEVRHNQAPQSAPIEDLEYDGLQARIGQGNQEYRIVRDASGRRHEMTIFNAGHPKRALKPSTSYSGLLKNPANFLETAVLATVNPDTEIVYWTSFGNYPTGHLDKSDRQYQRATGRYTKGIGTEDDPYKAIDAIRYLTELLDKQGVLPTHFIADQEAGRLALALMADLPENSVRGAYFNAIDGLSHHANYLKDDFVPDMLSRIRRRRQSESQPGDLTPVNIKEVKAAAPTIYHGPQKVLHLPPFVWLPRDLRDKVSYERGRGTHKDLGDLPDHAVYNDASAALRQQEAIITVRLNENGGQDVQECKLFGSLLMRNIPEDLRSPRRGVRFLVARESLTANTDNPRAGAHAVRQALNSPEDRRSKMVAALPGALSLSQIFDLAPVSRAA